jgi:hypothetical protein
MGEGRGPPRKRPPRAAHSTATTRTSSPPRWMYCEGHMTVSSFTTAAIMSSVTLRPPASGTGFSGALPSGPQPLTSLTQNCG